VSTPTGVDTEGRWNVHRVAALPGWACGVAVTASGRLFVSAPQADQPAPMPTLAEIVDGTARPFPDEIADQLTSVQGLRASPGPPDILYALDSGVRALSGNDPSRAALVVIDVTAPAIVRRYQFSGDVVLPSTYLNDLTVDAAGTAAYLIDAGGDEPHGLIVLDLATGHARRVLHDHPTIRASASPAPGGITVAGAPLTVHDPDDGSSPVKIGATGITLAEHDRTLFWNRADELFSIPVAQLNDPAGTDADVDGAITTWPLRDFASDGLDHDDQGNVLLTDLAHNAVQSLDTATGSYQMLATDPDISWPDGVTVAPDGSVYVTSSQIHRSTMFGDTDERNPPFAVLRLTRNEATNTHARARLLSTRAARRSSRNTLTGLL